MADRDSITAVEYRIVPGGDRLIYRIGTDASFWSSKDGGKTWNRLRPSAQRSGHLRVFLGRKAIKFLHRLMLETFVGPCPEGMECCHRNDNPRDNRLENLYWGSRRDNSKDAIRNGRIKTGGSSPAAKLTEEQAIAIVARWKGGEPQLSIARNYGVTIANVQAICYGITWSHATGVPPRVIGNPTGTRAKLSEPQVLAILEKCRAGMRQADVAAEFGVTTATVGGISRGFSWNHVTGLPPIRQS